MRSRLFIALLVEFTLTLIACAQDGPKNAVVLIIRHAEDGATDQGLTPSGQKRAEAYKDYFIKFTVDDKRLEPNVLFAAKDSKKSHRPRLTLEPFAKAEKLQIDTRFGNGDATELAAAVRATGEGKVVLICWRHPYVPALLSALGANPKDLLPGGKWPSKTFDWVIVLRYDQDGHLASSRRINQHLIEGDSQE